MLLIVAPPCGWVKQKWFKERERMVEEARKNNFSFKELQEELESLRSDLMSERVSNALSLI